MRRLLLALPFALLPLAVAHAAEDHDHEHGSLAPHEHGVASLNVARWSNTGTGPRRPGHESGGVRAPCQY